MANLTFVDKQLFEKLFDRGGYVVGFSDRTFGEFFNDFNIEIHSKKYHLHGTSKMKKLRAFWEIEDDKLVSKVLRSMLQYIQTVSGVSPNDLSLADNIFNRLDGVKSKPKTINKQEFLEKDYGEISLTGLGLDNTIVEVLTQRVEEIKICLESKASLSAIFLIGSTLEGILLGVALKDIQKYNSSKSSPKDKEGKVKKLQDWTLSNMIDVACDVGHLQQDVKKFSHAVRDFRNYIHPYQQMSERFNPTEDTAQICWKVLQAAVNELNQNRG